MLVNTESLYYILIIILADVLFIKLYNMIGMDSLFVESL